MKERQVATMMMDEEFGKWTARGHKHAWTTVMTSAVGTSERCTCGAERWSFPSANREGGSA